MDLQNSALWGWTKGPVLHLVSKQKNNKKIKIKTKSKQTLLQLSLEIFSEITGTAIAQQENYLHH